MPLMLADEHVFEETFFDKTCNHLRGSSGRTWRGCIGYRIIEDSKLFECQTCLLINMGTQCKLYAEQRINDAFESRIFHHIVHCLGVLFLVAHGKLARPAKKARRGRFSNS